MKRIKFSWRKRKMYRTEYASTPISPWPIPTQQLIRIQWLGFEIIRHKDILGCFQKLPMKTEVMATNRGHDRYNILKHYLPRCQEDWPRQRTVAVRLERPKKSWWRRFCDWLGEAGATLGGPL